MIQANLDLFPLRAKVSGPLDNIGVKGRSCVAIAEVTLCETSAVNMVSVLQKNIAIAGRMVRVVFIIWNYVKYGCRYNIRKIFLKLRFRYYSNMKITHTNTSFSHKSLHIISHVVFAES